MSDLDLDAIEARANAATEGDWTVKESGGVDGTGEGWSQVEVDFGASDDWRGPPGLMLGDHENAVVDAEFIAHARTDVPALVAELRSVREELAAAQDALARVEDLCREREPSPTRGMTFGGSFMPAMLDTTELRALVGLGEPLEPDFSMTDEEAAEFRAQLEEIRAALRATAVTPKETEQ